MHKVVGSIAVAAGALFLQGCNSDDKKKCELKYQQLQSDGLGKLNLILYKF